MIRQMNSEDTIMKYTTCSTYVSNPNKHKLWTDGMTITDLIEGLNIKVSDIFGFPYQVNLLI